MAIATALALGLPRATARSQGGGAGAGEAATTRTARRVALTFDDLPLVPSDFPGGCEPAEVVALNRRLLDGLTARSIPATGLVVAGQECGAESARLVRRVLSAWVDAGFDLGNHTYSHRDLNGVELDWYLADLERGAAVVDSLLRPRGRRVRFFRAPLLHMGDTPDKREGLRAFLAERGYAVAPVTIDNQEWVYAAVYARAKHRGKEALAERVVAAYLDHIDASFAFYERLSLDVFGREIPQVLLLHINRLNVDNLGALLERIRARGYGFIALDDAIEDPAYGTAEAYVGPRGLSWIQRWALERGVTVPPEPREAGWIAELFEAGSNADSADVPSATPADPAAAPGGAASGTAPGVGTGGAAVGEPGGEVAERTSESYIAGASGRPRATPGLQ